MSQWNLVFVECSKVLRFAEFERERQLDLLISRERGE